LLVGRLSSDAYAAGIELHNKIFETLPGFVWLNGASVLLGSVYMFAFAWIFGTYFVWMHNSSLEKTETAAPASHSLRVLSSEFERRVAGASGK
jgi:hypothetical protein